MKIAIVFPGQGSQTPGMGLDFFQNFSAAKEVFEESNDALKEKFSQVIFEGPSDQLTETQNAQPALLTTCYAMLKVLEKELSKPLIDHITYFAGHSLGEYTAICAAEGIAFTDSVLAVRNRGVYMQAAVPKGEGGMLAIIGLDHTDCYAIAKEASSTVAQCFVANDNSPGQIIISGHHAALEQAATLAKEKGAKRAIPLEVSAPFHCPLMQKAADQMADYLDKMGIQELKVPIISNVRAMPISDGTLVKQMLVKQVTEPVRWRESVQNMKQLGITHIIEVGPGKVLGQLVKRTEGDLSVHHLSSIDQLDETLTLFSPC